MLTTEQKINLLILAGFEPRAFLHKVPCPRIVRADGLKMMSFNEVWRVENYPYGIDCANSYHLSEWDAMSLNTCPDKLIYKAIESP